MSEAKNAETETQSAFEKLKDFSKSDKGRATKWFAAGVATGTAITAGYRAVKNNYTIKRVDATTEEDL